MLRLALFSHYYPHSALPLSATTPAGLPISKGSTVRPEKLQPARPARPAKSSLTEQSRHPLPRSLPTSTAFIRSTTYSPSIGATDTPSLSCPVQRPELRSTARVLSGVFAFSPQLTPGPKLPLPQIPAICEPWSLSSHTDIPCHSVLLSLVSKTAISSSPLHLDQNFDTRFEDYCRLNRYLQSSTIYNP